MTEVTCFPARSAARFTGLRKTSILGDSAFPALPSPPWNEQRFLTQSSKDMFFRTLFSHITNAVKSMRLQPPLSTFLHQF
jgi:hypothetical protein